MCILEFHYFGLCLRYTELAAPNDFQRIFIEINSNIDNCAAHRKYL